MGLRFFVPMGPEKTFEQFTVKHYDFLLAKKNITKSFKIINNET